MKTTLSSVALAATTLVTIAAGQKLDKPAARDNLDYLNPGLTDNRATTAESHDEWGAGYIPKDCLDMTTEAGLDPKDVKTYNVKYEDCGDAWVICQHKDAATDLQTVIDNFGRLPVGTRNWVRHVITLPDSGPHAYNAGGNIAMFGNAGDALTVWVHEAGHSLDLLGAYGGGQLSSSQEWTDAYDQDSAVPDPYAQSNQVENVAQNTVLASFEKNVDGGLNGIDADAAGKTSHQWGLVGSKADDNGDVLKAGTCSHRLENSEPVSNGAARSRIMRSRDAPSVALSDNVKIIKPKKFHTRDICFKH